MSVFRSKRFRKISEGVSRQQSFSVEEAVKRLKLKGTAKFDESVDLAIKLAIDSRQADQLVRGSLSLPHGIGKQKRVIAFCDGQMADAARAAGAIEVGAQDLADKILAGWADFDTAIAHPAMMKFVGRLGKVLGPKGLMPSPKNGTVTDKVEQAVKEFTAGKIEYRNDKEGNIHMVVGKVSFDEKKLRENIQTAIQHIQHARPQAVKGDYITGIFISSTMGPGIRIQHIIASAETSES